MTFLKVSSHNVLRARDVVALEYLHMCDIPANSALAFRIRPSLSGEQVLCTLVNEGQIAGFHL